MINDLQATPADLITKKPDDLSVFIKGENLGNHRLSKIDTTKRQHQTTTPTGKTLIT